MADGNIKSRGRSGSRRRITLTKIPGPSAVTEEDDWSEPDKEESRRRIGLQDGDDEDCDLVRHIAVFIVTDHQSAFEHCLIISVHQRAARHAAHELQ